MSSQDSATAQTSEPKPPTTIYENFGGESAFIELVERFYEYVEEDEVLRPMFPSELRGVKRRLYLFLIQFFGGPKTYSLERGHPRLRLRHAPFPITPEASQRWLRHMMNALEELLHDEEDANRQLAALQIRQYFTRVSGHLVNRPETD